MTDKKITDEEIIRNYEWCIGCTSDRCRECTMDEEGFCEEELQDLVLDLINRQKTEIEKLKGSTIVSNIMESQRIKREAYKEFLEKAAIELTNAYSSEYAHWIDDTLNNLLEELVGENNERNIV